MASIYQIKDFLTIDKLKVKKGVDLPNKGLRFSYEIKDFGS